MNSSIKFNTKAKEYVPKLKTQAPNVEKLADNLDKIQFNLKAEEFVPKPKATNVKSGFIVGSIDDSDEEEQQQKFTINAPVKKVEQPKLNEPQNETEQDDDIDLEINNDLEDDSDHENEWIPKFKSCLCCKGFVYNCKGEVCANLECCFCKAQEDFDPEI